MNGCLGVTGESNSNSIRSGSFATLRSVDTVFGVEADIRNGVGDDIPVAVSVDNGEAEEQAGNPRGVVALLLLELAFEFSLSFLDPPRFKDSGRPRFDRPITLW
jgi:hypothetical protein